MDNGINSDQLFESVIKAYTKAKEKGLSAMDVVIILVIGVLSILFYYGIKNGYLNNEFRIPERQRQDSPVRTGSKKQAKVDVLNVLQQICDKAPKKDADSYNNIREIIKNKKMDERQLLNDSIKDLFDELELEDETERNDFLNMRVALRLKIFEKNGPIIIEDTNIIELDWYKVCQLLEENVKPGSKQKRLEWYKYIEENGITGKVLLENTPNIKKNLKLSLGQETNFKDMMNNIRGDVNQGTSSTTISVSGQSASGSIITGGSANINDVHVTGTRKTYYGKKPQTKKSSMQEDSDDNDNEDSSSS